MGSPRTLLDAGRALTKTERFNIRFIQKTLDPGPLDRAMRFCQRTIGATWIDISTRRLRHVHGVERLPREVFGGEQSFLCVANHRSFFDLYVVCCELVLRGMRQRLLFPVRSNFFYDKPLGFAVNGVMSFFAMYPPVFRDPKRAALNVVGLDEIVRVLQRGGAFVGVHPEGTRKKDDDPYTFLPAQSGVGRIIHHAKVPVLPVFINGLVNDLVAQVSSNFTGKGKPVHIVFGAPIDFKGMLEQPPSPRLYKRIAERCLEVIGELGQEEKAIRSGR